MSPYEVVLSEEAMEIPQDGKLSYQNYVIPAIPSPYYFMDGSLDRPVKETKRNFQFYGARGKKSLFSTQEKR